MIVNVMILNNEIQLLLDRLKYEFDFYDKFIITEATTLFNGLSKPLYFQEYNQLFRPYLEKIQYIVIRTLPKPIFGSYLGTNNIEAFENRWPAEILMRDYFINCIDNYDFNDLFIIQDVDEIPNISSLNKLVDICSATQEKFFSNIPMHWFHKGLTNDCLKDKVWSRSIITNKKSLYTYESANKLRCAKKSDRGEWITPSITHSIKNLDGSPICSIDKLEDIRFIDSPFKDPNEWGWHVSSMHCKNNILSKMKSSSFSHAEFGKSLDKTNLSLKNPVEILKIAAHERKDLASLKPLISKNAPIFLTNETISYYL